MWGEEACGPHPARKEGKPLNIRAIANVKVSSDPAVRNNAIERFRGRDLKIVQVSKENLEGKVTFARPRWRRQRGSAEAGAAAHRTQ